jgi:hypothetical protein
MTEIGRRMKEISLKSGMKDARGASNGEAYS